MHVAIVEDNNSEAKILEEYLTHFSKENGTEINCTRFQDGKEFLDGYRHKWDLILLDIEMPVMNGMEAARKIRQIDTEVVIIFITQMAQYAIEGYSVNALDYVLKPINYTMFAMKMRRVLHELGTKQTEFLVLQKKTEIYKLPLKEIQYIEVYGHTIVYHTVEADISITSSRTIKQTEAELSGKGFSRCHQCFLVNLYHVNKYDKEEVWVGNKRIPVSRNRRKNFLQALMEYWGG